MHHRSEVKHKNFVFFQSIKCKPRHKRRNTINKLIMKCEKENLAFHDLCWKIYKTLQKWVNIVCKNARKKSKSCLRQTILFEDDRFIPYALNYFAPYFLGWAAHLTNTRTQLSMERKFLQKKPKYLGDLKPLSVWLSVQLSVLHPK